MSTAHSGTWSSKYLPSLSCSIAAVQHHPLPTQMSFLLFWHPCLAQQHELIKTGSRGGVRQILRGYSPHGQVSALKQNRWGLSLYPWLNKRGLKTSSENTLCLINTKPGNQGPHLHPNLAQQLRWSPTVSITTQRPDVVDGLRARSVGVSNHYLAHW